VERDALAMLLEGDAARQRALRKQWSMVESVVRTPDPVGVYIDFNLPGDVDPIPGNPDFELSDVWADSAGADTIGFILFVRDGRLAVLEGYVSGDCYPHDEGRPFVLRRQASRTL
jgi:hypothetical protein